MSKTVVITGASSGIGKDAALYFNELGYLVFAGVRRPEDGERVRAEASRPESLLPLLLDVTRSDQISAAKATVLERVGQSGLDVLISNAGIAEVAPPASCEQTPIETQRRVMEVNFFGAVQVVQAFLPLLRRSRGRVVFNTALMAHTVIPFNGGYAASKCALEGWADSLRREVQPLGVDVAIIEAAYLSSGIETKGHHASGEESSYPLEAGLSAAISKSATRAAGLHNAAPRRMSEAMVAAATGHRRPRPRRIVGAGAPAIWLLGCLPDRWQDSVFRIAIPRLGARSRPAAHRPGSVDAQLPTR